MRKRPTVFLSGPITHALTPEGFDGTVRTPLERIADRLELDGFRVLSAHRVESWGKNIPASAKAIFRRDWHFARACEAIVVVLPGDGDRLYRSDGTFIEIGWAIALGKPVFVVADLSTTDRSVMFDGLIGVTATAAVHDIRQDRMVDALVASLRARLDPPQRSPHARRLAFCATGFGFGPVSKAVATAQAVRTLLPEMHLAFLGADITEGYARASGAFDEVIPVDADATPEDCVEHAQSFAGLVNSLNLAVLKQWDATMPPQFFLDSLAWMWPRPPDGIENARSYLVQDFLLDAAAVDGALPANAVLTPPILSPTLTRPRAEWEAEDGYLLVNLGGCRNPYRPSRAYERYVHWMLDGLVGALRGDGSEPHRIRRVLVCGNPDLLATARTVDWSDTGVRVECRFVAHAEFLHELRRCESLLTSPGLTATLEALALEVPSRMLLPQNYSQFRIDAHYRALGLGAALWPRPLASERLADPEIEEAEGVAEVARLVDEQLDQGVDVAASAFRRLLGAATEESVTDPLRRRVAGWDGSVRTAGHVLRELDATAVLAQIA